MVLRSCVIHAITKCILAASHSDQLVLKVLAVFCEFHTYFEAHPIKGFSQRSTVSNSMYQFLVLNEPDCIAVLAGTKILAFRSLTSQSGTPVVVSITS